MDDRWRNSRWLNNPTRRVGRQHLLHVVRSTVGERHPEYRTLKARIDGDEAKPRAGTEPKI